MNPRHKPAAGAIVLGIAISALAFAVNALLEPSPRIAQMCSLGIVFGAVILVAGCIQLAIAKGHRWYVGLLGLLSVVGVAILWFVVPDKS